MSSVRAEKGVFKNFVDFRSFDGIFFQNECNQTLKRATHISTVRYLNRLRSYIFHYKVFVLSVERYFIVNHCKKSYSKGPYVCFLSWKTLFVRVAHLWRHEVKCSLGFSQSIVFTSLNNFAHTKISYHWCPLPNKYILRLYVSMQDSRFMQCTNSFTHAFHKVSDNFFT